MARGLTLDTGALIAIERTATRRARNRANAVWRAAEEDGVRITVPTVVVLEWWRGQHGPAARLLDGMEVEPLSEELARLAGAALAEVGKGKRGRPSAIDAVVVASAAQRGDVVYTSDVEDLERVRVAAFPEVKILGI